MMAERRARINHPDVSREWFPGSGSCEGKRTVGETYLCPPNKEITARRWSLPRLY